MKKLQDIIKEHKVLSIITGVIVLSILAPLITNTIIFTGIVLGAIWAFAICCKK